MFLSKDAVNDALKRLLFVTLAEWGLKKSELPWEQSILTGVLGVFPVELYIGLPHFNGVPCKLAMVALFIYLI